MNSKIFLIRHGETAWSLSGQHTGRTDLPLTAKGEQNALKVGERLQATKFDYVFTSPRQRTRQTCELAGLGRAAQIEPDLAEWDYGDYEGQRTVDILKERAGWNLFKDGAPNGETAAQVSVRADRFIDHLKSLEGNIAVFSHGHFGRVLAARWIGLTVSEARHFLLNAASLSILSYEHNNLAEPVIALWNSE